MEAMIHKQKTTKWETEFNSAFDKLCVAFWADIKSRQRQQTLTLPSTTGNSSRAPPHSSPSGSRAKMAARPISHPQLYGTATGALQDYSPTAEDGGLGGVQALAYTPARRVEGWDWTGIMVKAEQRLVPAASPYSHC
ncbi:Hypothetical predicted protein [Pelobates cultripes]|uniref:Uncharacterized protein n=1 Tax=Pelobates cultripes TaxID=61616 RepID=A0AAD1VS90_PELCU|nr:Hypothetical predicted protein [Pelobates cultripes]